MKPFFDDDNKRHKFKFSSAKIKHQNQLNSPPIISSTLSCLNPGTKFPKEAYYSLYNHILVHSSNERSRTFTVLEIGFATLKLIPPHRKFTYGFRLARNSIAFDFFTNDKEIFDNWLKALRNSCILTSFHSDFRTIRTLGKGGFAKVFLAESNLTKTYYAIKGFSKKNSNFGEDKVKPSIINEISIMRALNHENVVKLYEVHESEHSIYLVMELIKGRTLEDFLRKRSKRYFSETKVRELMQTILSSLVYMGSQGIYHRDLKPANILLENNEKIKIADFGLATTKDNLNPIFKKCGTPGYMAPEILAFDDKSRILTYDDKVDVFSIGCIFYNLLFGSPLFQGSKQSELIERNRAFSLHSECLYLLQTELFDPQSKIDREALHLVQKLLDPDPKRRPTAQQALEHAYFQTRSSTHKNSYIETTTPTRVPSGLLTPPLKYKVPSFQFTEEFIDSGSFLGPGANRFLEKESICIDIGKAGSEVKFEDLMSSCSMQSPLLQLNEEGSEFGSNLQLPLEKPRSPSHRKSQTQSHLSFLKAAIFNNINRQQEIGSETDTKASMAESSRMNNNFALHISIVKESMSEQDVGEEIAEVGNLGEEGLKIQSQMDYMNQILGEMIPNKKFHATGPGFGPMRRT